MVAGFPDKSVQKPIAWIAVLFPDGGKLVLVPKTDLQLDIWEPENKPDTPEKSINHRGKKPPEGRYLSHAASAGLESDRHLVRAPGGGRQKRRRCDCRARIADVPVLALTHPAAPCFPRT